MPSKQTIFKSNKNLDFQIEEALSKLLYDPLGFVYWAYPWKKKGTVLHHEEGPDEWQRDFLNEIGDLMYRQEIGEIGNLIQYAVKAGRGPGKTTVLAWIQHWFVSTRPKCQGVVTANTKTQLETRTWRELAKWHDLSVHKHWFEFRQSKFLSKFNPTTWFLTPVVWSKENAQAVAGAHENYVIIVFDEASNIDDIIWDTIEGGLTDPHVLWIVAGNPTLTTGRFRECWREYKHRWITRTIDSRTSKRADKEQIAKWIEDRGEDDDFVRVWVKGEFPKVSVIQFIPDDVVEQAVNRTVIESDVRGYPILIGVDIARHGRNYNAIYVRQGYYTHELWTLPTRIENLMEMVGYIHAKIVYYRNLARGKEPFVFIDVGMGYGIIDRLRELQTRNVFEVNFGAAASEPTKYNKKRAEMYARLKRWLMEGGKIPDNANLKQGLVSIQAGEDKKSRLQCTEPYLSLTSKKDIKESIPLDEADALACTFAMPIGIEMADYRREPQKIVDSVENPFYFGRNSSYLDLRGLQ